MAGGAKREQWSDTNTKRFLLYVAYALGGSPTAQFGAIAEKMGDGYTVSALQNKWHRLRAEVADAGGLDGLTPAAKGKKAALKKTTTDEEGAESKKARGRPKRKADSASPVATPEKKVKVEAEASEELEEGEIKEEAVEVPAKADDEI